LLETIFRRLIYLGFGIASFIVSFYIGANIDINNADVQNILKQTRGHLEHIDQFGIFLNNIKVAVAMFIPGAGAGLGIYSAISTGLVFDALVHTYPALKNMSPLVTLFTPFAVIELFAYGLAISRSGILVYQLIRKRKAWKQYTLQTIVEIIIVIVLLFIGSSIEWHNMIQRQQIS
jgi:uncharacterized membrane protein SpoIIM required for sporulation